MTTNEELADIERLLSVLQKEEEFIIKPFRTGKIIKIIIEKYLILLCKIFHISLELLLNVEKLYHG